MSRSEPGLPPGSRGIRSPKVPADGSGRGLINLKNRDGGLIVMGLLPRVPLLRGPLTLRVAATDPPEAQGYPPIGGPWRSVRLEVGDPPNWPAHRWDTGEQR